MVIENQKGVLVLSGKTLQRLDPQKSYDVAQAQTKELSEKAIGRVVHPKDKPLLSVHAKTANRLDWNSER